MKRLERSRHQRDRLLRELDEVWSFLEDGIPGLETDLESHPMEEGTSTTRKRKRGGTKEDEVRRLVEEPLWRCSPASDVMRESGKLSAAHKSSVVKLCSWNYNVTGLNILVKKIPLLNILIFAFIFQSLQIVLGDF